MVRHDEEPLRCPGVGHGPEPGLNAAKPEISSWCPPQTDPQPGHWHRSGPVIGQARPGQAVTGTGQVGTGQASARPGPGQAAGQARARPGQAGPGQARLVSGQPGQAEQGQASARICVQWLVRLPGQARLGQARPGQSKIESNRSQQSGTAPGWSVPGGPGQVENQVTKKNSNSNRPQ
jgi:hypothetical protein